MHHVSSYHHPAIHKARNAFANVGPLLQIAEKRTKKPLVCVPAEKSNFHQHDTGRCLFLLLLACLGRLFFLLGIASILGGSTALDTTTLLEYVDEAILVNGLEVPLGDLLLPANYTSLAFSI